MQSIEPLVDTLQEAFSIFRHRMMGNFFIYAKDKGLTMAQFGTMINIYHRGGCGVSDLGSELGVTNSAASQMLERLVQLKLVTRTEDPSDRRVKLIVLTDKGRQILQEGNLAGRSWLEDLARSMSAEEQEQVQKAVLVLIEKARLSETIPS